MTMKKRIATISTAMILAVSIMCSAASAATTYNLHYTAGAPSSENCTHQTFYLSTSGASRITVNSTYFSAYITGAYCQAQGTGNYPTNPANINSTGTYYLEYIGDSVPKAGKSVTVTVNLIGHNDSRSVASIGTISA